MATTNYYTFGGRILAENQVGGTGFRSYGADALGSVVATYDNTGALQNSYRYSPYGKTIATSGTGAAPAYQWVGGLGYRVTGRKFFECYVRARHFSTSLAIWTTVDPLWPGEPQYGYVGASPVVATDPEGLIWATKCDCISEEQCIQHLSINDKKGNQIFNWTGKGHRNPPGCVMCGSNASRACGATQTQGIKITSTKRPPRHHVKAIWDVNVERTCSGDGCPGHLTVSVLPIVYGIIAGTVPYGDIIVGILQFSEQYLPSCNSDVTRSVMRPNNPVIRVRSTNLDEFQLLATATLQYECCDIFNWWDATKPKGNSPCDPLPKISF